MKVKYLIRNTSLALLAALTASNAYSQPTPPEGMLWEEVPALSDEFDSWDASKWNKSLWNYGEPVQMLAENSGVADGKLWIKATLDSTSTRWFETSRVMSKTQISYPMYTECHMRTAHISAYNTFWMNNGNIDSRDEIDMCENNSKPSITSQTERPYTMYSQYFVVVDGDTERDHGNFDNRMLSNENPLKGVKWNEAYHTIGVWWQDENNIQFYLNGEAAGKVISSRDFTRNLNIIWDLWTIDATWSGGIAVKEDLMDDEINTMYVDWIHTYKLEADETWSIVNAKDDNIHMYPNPAKDVLNFGLSNNSNIVDEVHIYNSLGHKVRSMNTQEEEKQISLNGLSSGIYIVKLLCASTIYSKTFIKE